MRQPRRSMDAFWDNLRQDMPLWKTLALLIRNRARIPPTPCCGHPGEPGC